MDYMDIIEHPHHVSKMRRHMTNRERAAQFASFQALTGLDTAIAQATEETTKVYLPQASVEWNWCEDI